MAGNNGHKAYHYTGGEQILRIMAERSSTMGTILPISSPVKRLRMPDNLPQKYFFAFFDSPEPADWTKNPEFPDMWTKVVEYTSHGGLSFFMLEFDLLPDDVAYVADWAHMERAKALSNEHTEAATKPVDGMKYVVESIHPDRDDIMCAGEAAYIRSFVPLAEYSGGYVLPELAIANPVSMERVKVHRFQ